MGVFLQEDPIVPLVEDIGSLAAVGIASFVVIAGHVLDV